MQRPQKPSLIERAILRSARWIAGPERGGWLDAMEAELHHLIVNRIDWVLGSLVASVKDRARREWADALVLLGVPALALAALLPVSLAATTIARAAGLTEADAARAIFLAPLPFAYWLGHARPKRALWAGTIGFLLYQTMPVVAWRTLMGDGVAWSWGANLASIGVMPNVTLAATLGLWLLGASLGARRAILR